MDGQLVDRSGVDALQNIAGNTQGYITSGSYEFDESNCQYLWMKSSV